MASYALPTVSPPAYDFERRSFFSSALVPDNSHSHLPVPTPPARPHPSTDSTRPLNDHPSVPCLSQNYVSMPKNRPRGESDLGKPQNRARTVSTAYKSSKLSKTPEITHGTVPEAANTGSLAYEFATAILIPAPFLFSSLLSFLASGPDDNAHLMKANALRESLDTGMSRGAKMVLACASASAILILVGLVGRMIGGAKLASGGRSRVAQDSSLPSSGRRQIYLQRLRSLCSRAASVVLPFLATAEIGGVRTGVFMLASTTGDLLARDFQNGEHFASKGWKRAFTRQKWTGLVFISCLICDLLTAEKNADLSATVRGYLLLAKSILLFPFPMPEASFTRSLPSPLVKSRGDIEDTLAAGVIFAIIAYGLSVVLSVTPHLTTSGALLELATIASSAGILLWSRPSSLRSSKKVGLIAGILCCVAFQCLFSPTRLSHFMILSTLFVLAYVAVQLDARAGKMTRAVPRASTERRNTNQHHHHLRDMSRITRLLLQGTEDFPLIHSILLDKQSRRIVYFMCINLGFMFIQTFYALVAGSLGLLSDSIHMLFDCVGLLAGLAASVMSRWPPNAQFPYGYGKVETLSGLGNGIFLMIISVEIIWESFERFMEGAELRRLTELLVVSVGGLVVNCIGLGFIGHHHHGHSHKHAHTHGDSTVQCHGDHLDGHKDDEGLQDRQQVHQSSKEAFSLNGIGSEPEHHHHGSPHSSGGHGHAHENMAGIYLHILADTMGSVAVIASTILTKYTGWSGWDPIASCTIAVLIIIASYPLVVGSARQLLLTLPSEVEYALRSTLQELSGLRGVDAYAVPRFWLDDVESEPSPHAHHLDHEKSHSRSNDHHNNARHAVRDDEDKKQTYPQGTVVGRRLLGVIHIIAAPNADLNEVRIRVSEFFESKSIDALVQVEREQQSQCWCGGDQSRSHTRDRSTVAI